MFVCEHVGVVVQDAGKGDIAHVCGGQGTLYGLFSLYTPLQSLGLCGTVSRPRIDVPMT